MTDSASARFSSSALSSASGGRLEQRRAGAQNARREPRLRGDGAPVQADERAQNAVAAVSGNARTAPTNDCGDARVVR